MRRLLVLFAACALLVPAAAWAHASLWAESPGFQQEVRVAPTSIRLSFDQFVQFPSIQVYDAKGKTFAGRAVAHGLNVAAPVRRLPRGAYTVRWHVLSADGHVVSGVWTFGVGVKAPPPMEASVRTGRPAQRTSCGGCTSSPSRC